MRETNIFNPLETSREMVEVEAKRKTRCARRHERRKSKYCFIEGSHNFDAPRERKGFHREGVDSEIAYGDRARASETEKKRLIPSSLGDTTVFALTLVFYSEIP